MEKYKIAILDDYIIIVNLEKIGFSDIQFIVNDYIKDFEKKYGYNEISTLDIVEYLYNKDYIVDYDCIENETLKIETNY